MMMNNDNFLKKELKLIRVNKTGIEFRLIRQVGTITIS